VPVWSLRVHISISISISIIVLLGKNPGARSNSHNRD
jgi:hypothetical protein